MRLNLLAATGLLFVVGEAAMAQPAPSAADIVNSLKPNASQLNNTTRGIRPATPSSAGTAEAAAPSVNLTVNFPTGSAALTPAAEHSLDALGHALTTSDLSGFHFRIEGHTDTVGTPDANRTLSQKRAEAVAAYLETKFGVGAAKLNAVGVGQDDLLVPTPDQTPEPKNRRVKIINLGA
jgi:outer membrane protein OmpA-like peptidoglycan-associated protein